MKTRKAHCLKKKNTLYNITITTLMELDRKHIKIFFYITVTASTKCCTIRNRWCEFASARVVLLSLFAVKAVLIEIDSQHHQQAHFPLHSLSWWCISHWPVFSKLNFPSWRLFKNSCLSSADITKRRQESVWQPQSIATPFIHILQALGADRPANQCPQA